MIEVYNYESLQFDLAHQVLHVDLIVSVVHYLILSFVGRHLTDVWILQIEIYRNDVYTNHRHNKFANIFVVIVDQIEHLNLIVRYISNADIYLEYRLDWNRILFSFVCLDKLKVSFHDNDHSDQYLISTNKKVKENRIIKSQEYIE